MPPITPTRWQTWCHLAITPGNTSHWECWWSIRLILARWRIWFHFFMINQTHSGQVTHLIPFFHDQSDSFWPGDAFDSIYSWSIRLILARWRIWFNFFMINQTHSAEDHLQHAWYTPRIQDYSAGVDFWCPAPNTSRRPHLAPITSRWPHLRYLGLILSFSVIRLTSSFLNFYLRPSSLSSTEKKLHKMREHGFAAL